MPRVEGAGVALACEERGSGAATVLVHGMGAPRMALDLVSAPRVIAYDRRGYGDSEAPQPYTRTTVSEQAEDLAALVVALDAAPALLVAEDLGGLVALDVLARHGGLVRGAVLVDPPVYWYVPEATEALSAQRSGLEERVRADGLDAAVAWWRGDGAARTGSALAFFADFAALATLELTPSAVRALAQPIAVVTSARARPHDVAAAEALLTELPSATRAADVADAVRRVGG